MTVLASTSSGEGPVAVLVHGFTQTASSMDRLGDDLRASRTVVQVDLPGHGGSAGISADLEETAALVCAAAGGESFDLVGYSLGARVALHAACAAHTGLRRVVAISASTGIVDPVARGARLERDEGLAARLETDGDVGAFIDRWLAQPMFATLRADPADLEARKHNTVAGLADSLRRCSLGTQRPLRAELASGAVPVLMVAGAADDQFVSDATRTAAAGPSVGAAVVTGAGHACHLERPSLTARLVVAYLAAG